MVYGTSDLQRRAKPRQHPSLPTFYYHRNFCDMLTFVDARYRHVFNAEHVAFLEGVQALSHGARCLYIRIAGRKGRVFNSDKFQYPEITGLPAALYELRTSGFVMPPRKSDYRACLLAMTKPELLAFMTEHMCVSGFKRAWKKEVLVDAAYSHVPFEAARLPLNFIVQGQAEPLRYLSYLHFGKIEDNLQSFTLRDLGIRKVPDFKSDYTARFNSREEAITAYFYAKALYQFRQGHEDDIVGLIDGVVDWPAPLCDISTASRDKLLQKLGGLSERWNDLETAIELYSLSDAPLCNERTIRIRYNRGEKAWCKARLEDLIENPGSDDEHNFAKDFYHRKFKKKRTSEVTDILRAGELLQLDETFKNNPERAAQKYYVDRGYEVHFTENNLWRTLFGLMFWDELYCSQDAALHSGFEMIPASLLTGQFYERYKDKVEIKLEALSSASNTHIQILKTVSRHHGRPNGIFRWNGAMINRVKTLIEAAPAPTLAYMLRLMAKDYKSTRDGFPDLMLIKDRRLSFVEVKASGDVIRRNQLTRIKQLRAAGIPTHIARIEWIIDPNQTYVVVDVETTGGRAATHRVTEIGAVKVRNGKVIDEFQTLVNPERSIPSFITKLTGITQDMVAGAPRFADVAAEFSDFMGDAIFAAHNVNFDYGFIREEYARVGQKFKPAKICTCASMRKYYPGYASYGLKNLCKNFQIPLESHHRALCDAQAAAELLFLVNDRRTT